MDTLDCFRREMAWDKKAIVSEIRDVLLLVAVSVVLTVSGVACRTCLEDSRLLLIMITLTSITWIALWKGNAFLAGYLSRKISWISFPLRRFIVGLIATVGYTFLVVLFFLTLYKSFFSVNLAPTMLYTVVITLAISLFMHGRSFLLNWRRTSIEAEQYQNESIMARYESLKNQVSPHFLFNSLNALTQLVYEDKDKAAKFIHKLSEVYRYVLANRDKEFVSVSEEVDFIGSYLFLQEIRFGDKLNVVIALENADGFVAPLALQMLIENAIKHNIVSRDEPLTIRIFQEDLYLVVENQVQKKRRYIEPSSGFGLENIVRRYEILTDRKVIIEEELNVFRVKLPLLPEVNNGKVTKLQFIKNARTDH